MWVVASPRLGAWVEQSAEHRAASMCHTWVFSSRCVFSAFEPGFTLMTLQRTSRLLSLGWGYTMCHFVLIIYISHWFLGITGDHMYPVENVQAGKDGVPLGLALCKYPATVLQDITLS